MRRDRSAALTAVFSFVVLAALCGSSMGRVSKRGEPSSSEVRGRLLLNNSDRAPKRFCIQASPPSADGTSFTMTMKGAEPKGKDSYICSGFKINDTVPGGDPSFFVTRFEPVNAASERAHHMILYTCDGVVNEETWDCRHHQVCGSGGPASDISFSGRFSRKLTNQETGELTN